MPKMEHYSYGEKLRNAAPNPYTFVRHRGMKPTNNKSEQKLRKIVMHKKIRQMFGSVTGMNVYGILVTCLMTWDDQGHDLSEKVYRTIMAGQSCQNQMQGGRTLTTQAMHR